MTIIQEKTLADKVRADFPILNQEINGKPLAYLDNAATSQKPLAVINALQEYYLKYNSNVHRGIHTLSSKATDAYEGARDVMEHHSNFVPWQIIAQKTGAILKFVELNHTEEFNLEQYKTLVSEKTKLVAFAHISNVLGCINPVKEICSIAHKNGAKVLIDACQSVPHCVVDVQAMDCDWLVASGHKMCAPTGIGFLYGKLELLEEMPPFLGGGEMIDEVFIDHYTYAELPHKFEAGTPAIGEAIALGAAVDYLANIGMEKIQNYEAELTTYLFDKLSQIPEVTIYGPQPNTHGEGRAALASFTVENLHPNDLSTMLDEVGVAIRSGHHCAQPLHQYLKVSSTARASLSFYNTCDDIDAFIFALKDTIEFFASIMS